MAVDGRAAVAQGEVERPAVAARRDDDARDVAVGHGRQLLALRAVGLDVDAGVEVSGPDLAEAGGVQPRDAAHGVGVGARFGSAGRREARREGGEDEGQKSSHASHSSMNSAAAGSTVS